MDITSIILAGIGGALGAGLGLLFGARMPRRGDGFGQPQIIAIALTVVGALIVPVAAGPLVSGERGAHGGRDMGAEVDAMFAENRMLQALATVDPDAQQRMRERAIEAFRTGGAEQAEQVMYEEAFVLGQTAVVVYGPRATDEALLGLQRTLLSVARNLMSEPQYCYTLLYSGIAPQNISSRQAMEAGRHAAYAPMQDAMVALVLAAGPEVIPHDPDRATLGTGELQGFVFNNYDENRLRYFSGYQPQNDAEFAAACDAMADLLEFQLNHEYAADMVRAGLMSGG